MPIARMFTGPKRVAALLLGLWIAGASAPAWGQQQPPALPPPGQTLTANQLNDLVAPIALYPDELVSQILVAATYPLEVVEANQWVEQNPKLIGPKLTEGAQKHDWDPSVQALVVFPDVMKLLVDDITWTTNLGNAFLAQQQDVMDAVQHMRQQAQQAGKLKSTPQENVVDSGGYVDIEPADPEVMYVPLYDPAWIWGPPLWYPYPAWIWPPRSILMGGLYFGFGGPIDMGLFFGGGWVGWSGWGWHPGWGGHTLIVNNGFIHRYNFNARGLASVRGTSQWAHDPEHRGGVPYANASLQQRYGGNVRQNVAARSIPEGARNAPGQTSEKFGNRTIPQNQPRQQQNRSAFGGMQYGSAASEHSEHGMSSMGMSRSMPMSAPRMGGGGGGGMRGGGGGGRR
jgi:hypothetical protein